MKIDSQNCFFKINFQVLSIFILYLVALFYGPSLVNLFYLLMFILFIYQLYTKKISLKFNLDWNFIIQITFCLYLTFNSFFITYENALFYKSLFYFRFLLIAFIISKIVNDEDHTLKYISFIFLLCSILLSLDIIYQSQTGFDIFGYQAGLCTFPDGEQNLNPLNCERFSGFFGDELIAGNFLVTYGLFFSYIFFTRLKKNFFNILLFSLSTLLIFLAIIISGERNAFLSILLILLFNILFNKKARTYLIYPILIFLLIFTFSFKKFEHIKYRYIDWPISSITSSEGNIFKKLLQTPWGSHYLTSYEIFSNNKIFGSGFKSFREECKKDIYSLENINKKYDLNIPYSGCSTHPHNMYIELLTEAGSVGFILFFILIFFIIFKPYFKNINYIKDKQDVIFVLSIIFSIMFPFRPTGSFSGTISASNLWFFIGFYLYFINNLKLKK
jgi:O-antigen ligase